MKSESEINDVVLLCETIHVDINKHHDDIERCIQNAINATVSLLFIIFLFKLTQGMLSKGILYLYPAGFVMFALALVSLFRNSKRKASLSVSLRMDVEHLKNLHDFACELLEPQKTTSLSHVQIKILKMRMSRLGVECIK